MSTKLEDQAGCLDLSPKNPLRKPEWRWLRNIEGHDPWPDRFAGRMLSCRAGQRNRTLLEGIDIYEGDPLRRAELEARILARQTNVAIGARMDLSPEVIAWYRGAFFDVQPKLDFPSWVTNAVLKPDPRGVLGKHDVPFLWKDTGYWCPIAELEKLITAVDRQELARWGVDAYLQSSSKLSTYAKVAIAARRMPVPRTPAEFLRWGRVREYLADPRSRSADGEILSPLNLRVKLPEERRLAEEVVETVASVVKANRAVV